MSEGERSSNGAQSPVSMDEIENVNSEVEQLFAEGDRLIESIYNTLDNSAFNSTVNNVRATAASVSPVMLASRISPTLQQSEVASPLSSTIASIESPSRSLQESLEDGLIDAEIERIHRFCETIESNLASIGLNSTATSQRQTINGSSSVDDSSSDVSIFSASTPLNTRRQRRNLNLAEPVEVIDLSTYEYILPARPTANARFSHDVIDLCSPDVPQQSAAHSEAHTITNRQSHRRLFGAATAQARSRQQQVCSIGATNMAGAAPAHTEIDTLPVKRRRDEQNSQHDDSYKCPVCLESVRSRDPVSTKCGHVYCSSCIQNALRLTHKCPMCNKKVNARQIFRIYI